MGPLPLSQGEGQGGGTPHSSLLTPHSSLLTPHSSLLTSLLTCFFTLSPPPTPVQNQRPAECSTLDPYSRRNRPSTMKSRIIAK